MITPQEGAQVDRLITVAFRACNPEPDHHYWIIVYVHDNQRFYPQFPLPAEQSVGSWEGVAYFGTEDTGQSGQRYDIHVVLADSSANQTFTDYIARSQIPEPDSYEGLLASDYPGGVSDILNVGVTRK